MKVKIEPTVYVVLRQVLPHEDRPAGWQVENANVPAASAEAAIKLACKTDKEAAGIYVAVPARFWKPVKVGTKTETTLTLEEVKP